jgi:hypothetical protein
MKSSFSSIQMVFQASPILCLLAFLSEVEGSNLCQNRKSLLEIL